MSSTTGSNWGPIYSEKSAASTGGLKGGRSWESRVRTWGSRINGLRYRRPVAGGKRPSASALKRAHGNSRATASTPSKARTGQTPSRSRVRDNRDVPDADLSNPILNSPYDPPERISSSVCTVRPERSSTDGGRASRSSQSPSQEGAQGQQEAFDFDSTGERREEHADQRHPPRGRALAREQLERRHPVHPQAARPLVRRARTATIPSSSASARRQRPRSSSPRSRAATGRRTTAGGSSPRTRPTTTGFPASA